MRFANGHGTENDFVILVDPAGDQGLSPGLAARLCRHWSRRGATRYGPRRWQAGQVPGPWGAEAGLLDDGGHRALLQHRAGEVHAWLAGYL